MTDAVEPSEPAAVETSAEPEEERDAADELSHGISIRRQVAQHNIFNGSVTVLGDMHAGAPGDEPRPPIASTDVTDEFAEAARSFVEPPHFAELMRLVEQEHVVLLTGGGCGNLTAAGAALRAAKRHPILELPASLSTQELVDGIQQVCDMQPSVGILIASVDAETLGGFAGFELRRLRGMLARGAAVILTTRSQQAPDAQTHGLPTLEGVAPDAEQLVRTHGLSEDALAQALAALALLASSGAPVAPGTAVALAEGARSARCETPEQLAAAVSGQSDALDEWLADRPTAEHVASLAAAATLDGVPSTDVDAESARLTRLLQGEVEPTTEPKRFGSADRGWPVGVVGLGRQAFPTHFGVQEAEVVEVCQPHRRDRILAYLWDHLGADFRAPYLEWLRTLAEHPSPRIRSGAAVTAGVLFVKEPVTAERELLRPWALDGRMAQRECAGLAIGIPALLGSDPTPARALATEWGRLRSSVPRRRAAIAAYGGPLGAWDSGSAAPTHLWRIPAEAPELRRSADAALAALVAAGGEAGQVRATVIRLLAAQAEQRPAPRRAYELLPLLLRRLVRRDEPARESLVALLADAELESFTALAALLARAFDAPTGYASARAALCVLLDALADNRIDQDVVNRLIRAMKAAARPGRLAALGSQIERALAAEQRGDGSRSRAARAVHATFYSTPQEAL